MPGRLSELLVSPKKINFTGYKCRIFTTWDLCGFMKFEKSLFLL